MKSPTWPCQSCRRSLATSPASYEQASRNLKAALSQDSLFAA